MSVLFVVGRDNIPGGDTGARCAQTGLVRFHVIFPAFAFFDIGGTELPVF